MYVVLCTRHGIAERRLQLALNVNQSTTVTCSRSDCCVIVFPIYNIALIFKGSLATILTKVYALEIGK